MSSIEKLIFISFKKIIKERRMKRTYVAHILRRHASVTVEDIFKAWSAR